MHQSIATIAAPEFINLQPLDINPLMSSCEIKVLYIGENRNRSFITKEVASEMAKTLRGAPIVGYYKSEKDDFADHGDKIIIDDEGIKFECMTKPYGFVSPDAKVWFQKFEDKDEFGNSQVREYLMTTGFLWTGQFAECQSVVENSGKPQSMELDEDSLQGHWAQNNKTGLEFFIINDAIFSKLCILGEDVEPCFEGASVTAPQVSTSFTKVDESFKRTLFSMMEDLKKYTLKGGQDMEQKEIQTNFTENLDTPVETDFVENEKTTEDISESTDFAKKEDKDKEENKDTEKEDTKDKDDIKDEKEKEEDDEDDKKKFSLLEENFNNLSEKYKDLSEKYSLLEKDYQTLVNFKADVEDKKKDDLISSFYMLSDADKADVIANKSKYSYDEIEAKLSVMCVRKKVSFTENEEKTDNPEVTFNLVETEKVPAFINALRNTKKERQ